METTCRNFLIKRDFSSVQINIPFDLAQEIYDWEKSKIPQRYIDEPAFIRDNLHITVAGGLHTNSADDLREIIENQKPFEIKLGEMSFFEKSYCEVIKIGVMSPALKRLNKSIWTGLRATAKYQYNPHITITYVKKGRAKKLLDKNFFWGRKFQANEVVFITPRKVKTILPL